jgi:hypothetical protein
MTFEVQQKDQFIDLLAILLKRKRDIDREQTGAGHMVSYDRWLVDAVETLLQIEVMRRGAG